MHFDFELAAPRSSVRRPEYPVDADAGTPVVEPGYVEFADAMRGELRGFDLSVLNSSVTHPLFHSKKIETSVQSCIAPFPRSQLPNGRCAADDSGATI